MIADLIIKIAEQFEQEESVFSYRPSLLGPERCKRSLVYWGLNFPKRPLPGRAILVFEDGNWHEQLTLDRIRKSAYTVHSEQMHITLPMQWNFLPARKCKAWVDGKECGKHIPAGCMAGHIDCVLTDMAERDYLLEHKAINHFTFQRFWNGDLPLDYFAQTAFYEMGVTEDTPLEGSILLIKNKNTSQFLEFHLKYDYASDTLTVPKRVNSQGETIQMDFSEAGFMGRCFYKFTEVNEFIKQKRIPVRDYNFDDWQCEYCNWALTCWENYEKEFAEDMRTEEYLPQEFADMVRYWKECSARRLNEEKEEDKLKATILEQMRKEKIKAGKSGDYFLELKLKKRTGYNYELLPQSVRDQISTTTFSESLSSRKLKIPKEVKNHE